MVWCGTVFCAVAAGPNSTAVATSPDGITWKLGVLPSGDWLSVGSSVPNNFNSGKVVLSYSKDGGQTYSTPMLPIGSGFINNSRLIWYRLGAARQWQFNLTDTRMAKKVLLDAYIEVQGGTS